MTIYNFTLMNVCQNKEFICYFGGIFKRDDHGLQFCNLLRGAGLEITTKFLDIFRNSCSNDPMMEITIRGTIKIETVWDLTSITIGN